MVHGTLFKSDSNTIGTKIYLHSQYGIDVAGTGTWPPYYVPCDGGLDVDLKSLCFSTHFSQLVLDTVPAAGSVDYMPPRRRLA